MRTSLGLLLLLSVTGCPGSGSGSAGAAAVPSAEAWTAEHSGRVAAACARCHVPPPPDALPRARWAAEVAKMAAMPGPKGATPLTAEELALATAYYVRRAPEALPTTPAAPPETRLKLRVEGFTPKSQAFAGRAPATANVAFVHLSDRRRADLLVAELRSSALFLLPAWAPPEQRAMRHLAKDLTQPAHVELGDVDGDGLPDLLIAALGAMNPGNEPTGAVHLLRQQRSRRFAPARLLTGVGRASDARAADLDGDGDRDVVVAAFGWRGPGGLHLLERTGAGEPLAFRRRDLDDRDGFLHVEPVDLDGDGRLDLVALLAQEHEQVLAFMNRGELRFEPRVLFQAPHPAWGASGLEVTDLDGDGDPDVLLSNGDTLDDDLLKPYHGVSWLENQGELSFAHRPIGPLHGCERAVAGDLDGDGDLDVVAVAFLPQVPPETWRERDLDSVVWFERTADGWERRSLERHRCIHPTVAVADYDADGDLDVAVGNFVWMVEDGRPSVQADLVTLFTQERAPAGD